MFGEVWTERMTQPGRYVIIGAMATAIAGSFPQQMVGSISFSFFIALLGMCAILSSIGRPRLETKRTISPRCMAGATTELSIRLTNPTKSTQRDIGAYEFRLPTGLKLQEEPRCVESLAPGQSCTFEYQLLAQRRGSYYLGGPSAISVFPFGLTRSNRFSPQSQQFIVYPAFREIRSMEIGHGQSYQPGGVALASRVGDSLEFIGTREYRTGDRMRDLHPRSWARRGFPVVRQREEEFMTRVAIFVDTYSAKWRGGRGLEANLSLAAAVADYVSRRDYVVDLFAAGPQLYHFSAGRSLAHLEDILDILSCIERCGDDPLEIIGPQFAKMLPQTTVVVALMMNWDAKREAWVESVRSTGVTMKLIVVTDDKKQAERAVACGATHLRIAEAEAGVESI